jgi:hypothetical protein
MEEPFPSTSIARFVNFRFPGDPVSVESDPGFLETVAAQPLYQALDQFLATKFQAETVLVWPGLPDLKILFNGKMGIETFGLSGLVGSSDSSLDAALCPVGAPVLVFPLWNHKGEMTLILQMVRPIEGPEFTQSMAPKWPTTWRNSDTGRFPDFGSSSGFGDARSGNWIWAVIRISVH